MVKNPTNYKPGYHKGPQTTPPVNLDSKPYPPKILAGAYVLYIYSKFPSFAPL